jgi:methylated-DNA-[protein]-cysteine S-methyltransferase
MIVSENKFSLFETAHGVAALAWDPRGISSVRLPATDAGETRRSLLRRLPDAVEIAPPDVIARVIEAAQRYFEGERIDFADVPLALDDQDPLCVRIYALVRTFDWGETTTYGAVAKALGEGPHAARYVGQAMARNPIPLIIPCHRVLAAGGKIGGFSAPGGSDAKARMLALEGVQPEPPKTALPPVKQASFGF